MTGKKKIDMYVDFKKKARDIFKDLSKNGNHMITYYNNARTHSEGVVTYAARLMGREMSVYRPSPFPSYLSSSPEFAPEQNTKHTFLGEIIDQDKLVTFAF